MELGSFGYLTQSNKDTVICNLVNKVFLFLGNTGLNDLRISIYLRKSEVTVDRISVCNVNEKLMEHGTHSVMLF